MKRLSHGIILIAILGVTLAGCSRQSDNIIGNYPNRDRPSALRTSVDPRVTASPLFTASNVINGYLVQFDERVYINDQTTFSYTVSGAGAEHALSFFLLELPDCAPALDSFSPQAATIGIDPHTGIFGIKWNQSLDTYESRSYSITFPGNVPLGVIRASVKASTLAEIGEITGPCDGFEISGTVYVDTDGNGTMNSAEESGIIDVTVTLVDSKGNVQTATTDSFGDYTFIKIAGTYTVRIDAATAADDFNEDLAASFDPTGPTSKVITVGPDSPGNDFGFDPRAKEITYDLEQGILLTTGEPVKFWKRELRAAISGGKGNTEFDAATMAQFITEIQGLFLPDPFQFTPRNEFQEAMDILSTKSKDPLLILLRELLAAEFNEVSGKGLVDAAELQSVLIAWAESVALSAYPVEPPASQYGIGLPRGGIDDNVGDAIKLLIRLNGTTGGGSGGGG